MSSDELQQPEKNEAVKQEAPVAKTPETLDGSNNQIQSQQPQKTGALGVAMLGLAVFVLALSAGLSAFFFWDSLNELRSKQAVIASDLESNSERITPLVTALQRYDGEFSTIKNAVADLDKQSESMLKKIQTIDGPSKNDWLIAEVEHYVKLAQQRIELTHDGKGAARLLGHAVEVAGHIDAPGVVSLREALLTDQHSLAQTTDIDIEKIYLDLSVMMHSLGKLKERTPSWSVASSEANSAQDGLQLAAVTAVEEQQLVESDVQAVDWTAAWQQWRDFFADNLVRVRKVDQPVQPLLEPSQHEYLQQNLRLVLSQAQLAAMRGEGANFKLALDQAREWIGTYYDPNDAVTRDLLSRMQQYGQLNLDPSLPDIKGSLLAFSTFRDQWDAFKREGAK